MTGQLVLEGVRLPGRRAAGGEGLRGPLSCLNEARFGIVFGSMGAARDCLETAVDYAISREQFDRPIAGFQLTQAKLADGAGEYQKGSCSPCTSAGSRTARSPGATGARV